MIILIGDQKYWAESVSRNDLKGRFIDLRPKKMELLLGECNFG